MSDCFTSSVTSPLVRGSSTPRFFPLSVIGVDEWAKRKGRTYNTILVDLERHTVIDVLDDHRTEAVEQWLVTHPSVHTICRGSQPLPNGVGGAAHSRRFRDHFQRRPAAIRRFKYTTTRFKRHFRFSGDRYTVYVHVDSRGG